MYKYIGLLNWIYVILLMRIKKYLYVFMKVRTLKIVQPEDSLTIF